MSTDVGKPGAIQRRDLRLLITASSLRSIANGLLGVIAGIYLAQLGLSPSELGLVLGAGVAGTAFTAAGVTFFGDRFGRKRGLFWLALVAALGGVVVAAASQVTILAIAAFLGTMNSLGKDRGGSGALEQAILPTTVSDANRTRAFAWFNIASDVSNGVGALLATMPLLLRASFGLDDLTALRVCMAFYAALLAVSALCYARFSRGVEQHVRTGKLRISPRSRSILTRLSLLFALDSFAGGFLGTALFAYFFYAQFGVSEAIIALLFVGARIMNAFSHLGAAWLAQRIGLVKTMVFTHTPSSLLLMTIPFMDHFWLAALLFLIREGVAEMDVPTRQSYLMAVVEPEARTFAAGVTNLARMSARSISPLLAGGAMQVVGLWTPLVVAACLKITYDMLLFSAFRKVKPPEECDDQPGV